jgi:hypothetical protein
MSVYFNNKECRTGKNNLSKVFYMIKNPLKGAILLFTALVLLVSWLLPMVFPAQADASGQLTTRSLTLSSGVPGATNVQYTFTFSIVSTTPIKGLKFLACDRAYGTYNAGNSCQAGSAPTGMSFSSGPAAWVSQTGFGDNANSFARDGTGSTYCTPAANVLCANRATATTAETTGTARTIVFNGIKNPTPNNYAFYIGVYTYSATGTATALDGGTVASAVVQTLTINAQVAEVLQFCVGSTAVNDATTSVAGDCSTVSGTSLNLGTLDSSQINVSPWSTDGGDSNNGVAMIRTNAGNGATVAYDAIQASSGTNHLGTLRLTGASCNAGTVSTDGCINTAGTTQTTFTPGQEKFGMTVAGVNCGSNSGFSYTCNFSAGQTNLAPQTNYIGDTYTQGSAATFGTTGGFAWQESGAAVTIASSASSPVKQIDDEALILAFASTPAITTPFGAYSVQADFVATPTF